MDAAGLRSRSLGRSNEVVGPLGLGTWALGGEWSAGDGSHYAAGMPMGYGHQDDAESIRVVQAATSAGVRLIDTANLYGAGHGERLVSEALKGRRDKVFLAAWFGHTYDTERKMLTGVDVSPQAIRNACHTSIRNLQCEWIDLFQLQVEFLPIDAALLAFETLEELRQSGLIRYYGWSTNHPERVRAVASFPGTISAQFDLNVFQDAPDMLAACEEGNLAAIARLPLAMGFLTGKFSGTTKLPSNDVRSNPRSLATFRNGDSRAKPKFWLRFFEEGGSASPFWAAKLNEIRDVLTSGGRTVSQGALAWIWGRSTRTVAIPGARTVAQLEENVAAVGFGPLWLEQMEEIEGILDRHQDPGRFFLQPFEPVLLPHG